LYKTKNPQKFPKTQQKRHIMKKVLLSILFLIPAFAVAQETANVAVNTTVNASFALTHGDDLVFGNVQAADVVTVNATTGAATNAGSTAKRGRITTNTALPLAYSISGTDVVGTPASPSITLRNPDNDGLTVSLTFAVKEFSTAGYTLGASTASASNADNTLYIGGTFTAPAVDPTPANNTYTGTITVSAVYF
jgi:hypothetical protein